MSINRPLNPSKQPVDIHDALSEVRQMDEFQRQRPDDWLDKLPPELARWLEEQKEKLDKAMDQFYEFLKGILPQDSGLSGIDFAGPWALLIKYALMGATVVLTLVAIYMGLILVRRWWKARAGRPAGETLRTLDGTPLKSARRHRDEARRLAQAGQYEAAVRELYMALLCLLDETDVVPFETNRTNLEYLRRIRSLEMTGEVRDLLQSGFGELARTFEAVRYGGRSADVSGYRHCEDRFDRLSERLQVKEGQVA